MSAETIFLFLTAAVALAFAPGPDNLFVLAQSSQHGTRAGILVTLGLCTGLIFHTLLVAFGVAVVFQTSLLAFTLLKFAGASYLLYLAWQSFRANAATLASTEVSDSRLYLRGIFMNVTNPKVAIFFLAFLPQFVEPSTGSPAMQILMLGILFMITTLIVFGSVAVAAGFLSRWIRDSDKAQKILNYIAGAVFVTLAIRLLMIEQSD